MSTPTSNLRGILLMIASTGAFVANDSMMKLATDELPTLQVLFLRGVTATLWCLPLVLLTGNGRKLRMALNRWVLLRSVLEAACVLSFLTALVQLPIADITAIGQLAPMFLMIGAAIFLNHTLGPIRWVLIILGFLGALLVAQPTGATFSAYSLLGFATAFFMAVRDLIGRRIPEAVPSPIVAFSAIVTVLVVAGIGTMTFEQWVPPSANSLWLLTAAGFCLMFGHMFLFLAYRHAEVGAVAPFLYFFTIWAVVAGAVVFGEFPNALAALGMALIVASGVVTVMLDGRRRRLAALAA